MFDPAVLAISPATGSAGGSVINMLGSGFGPETLGLNILVNGAELCSEIKITGYGELTCKTNAIEISYTAVLSVSVAGTEVTTSFIAGDVSYSQTASLLVSSASSEGSSITFTGASFPTDGSYIAHASFGGIDATSVIITDETTVIAKWEVTGLSSIT